MWKAGRSTAEQIREGCVPQIIERFWSGSAEQFLAGMVDEKVLTSAQVRKLAAKIKDRK